MKNNFKNYKENGLKYHIDFVLKLMELMDNYNLKPDTKGNKNIIILFTSEIGKHLIRISEAKHIAKNVFNEDLDLPEKIEEQLKMIDQNFIVLKGDSLETKEGISFEKIIEELINKENK